MDAGFLLLFGDDRKVLSDESLLGLTVNLTGTHQAGNSWNFQEVDGNSQLLMAIVVYGYHSTAIFLMYSLI